MSIALHCDGPDCNTWARYGTDAIRQFVFVSDITATIGHFCSLWCMTRWGAERSEPTEVIGS